MCFVQNDFYELLLNVEGLFVVGFDIVNNLLIIVQVIKFLQEYLEVFLLIHYVLDVYLPLLKHTITITLNLLLSQFELRALDLFTSITTDAHYIHFLGALNLWACLTRMTFCLAGMLTAYKFGITHLFAAYCDVICLLAHFMTCVFALVPTIQYFITHLPTISFKSLAIRKYFCLPTVARLQHLYCTRRTLVMTIMHALMATFKHLPTHLFAFLYFSTAQHRWLYDFLTTRT